MFSNPHKNTEQLGLIPGMKVADLGAGTGAYTIHAAQAVGSNGHVYAVEVQKDLVSKLRDNAHSAGVHNIEYLVGDVERRGGTHIGDDHVDYVIAANILFQVESKIAFIQEVRRILKKGGKIAVIDWKESYGGIGPAAPDVVTETRARELFREHGFQFVRTISGGDHHYGLIYSKI